MQLPHTRFEALMSADALRRTLEPPATSTEQVVLLTDRVNPTDPNLLLHR